jgi:hypothetical protein
METWESHLMLPGMQESEGMNPTFPSGSWSLDGLLNLHRVIARSKLIGLKRFFISLEIS